MPKLRCKAFQYIAKATSWISAKLSPPEDISHWRNLLVLLLVTLSVCIYNWLVVIKGYVGSITDVGAALIGVAVIILALWVSIPAGAALKRYCKRQTLPHLIWVFTALCILSMLQVAFLPGLVSDSNASWIINLIGSLVSAVQLAITSWLVKVPWDRSTEAIIASNENQLSRKWDDPVI